MRDDRGAGTAFTAAWAMVLATIGGLGLGVVQGHLAAARVQAAADHAALAGVRGGADACSHASSIAARNGTRLRECAFDGGDLIVTVGAPAPSLLSRVMAYLDHGTDEVWATSRAGYPSS